MVGAGIVGSCVLLVLGAALLVRSGAHHQQAAAEPPLADATSDGDAGETTNEPEPDEAGAVDAAVTYAAAPQEWMYLNDDDIVDAVTEVATPASAERLSSEVLDKVRAARDELTESPGPVWWVVRPLAWRVESFADAAATVAVWTMSVLSAADVAMPQADWATTTLQLEWIDGAWRVADVRDTAGPTPAVGPTDTPWEPEPFADALEGFTRISSEVSR